MFTKTLAYVAFGGANLLSFAVFEQGGVNGQLLGAAIFVATVATNAIAFWAVTKEKFKSFEEWKKQAQAELEEIRSKAEKVNDQDRRLAELETFRNEYYKAGMQRFRHRES